MPTRLELSIAWRYLRGRQSRLLSFISVIAVGGIVVGVSALIVVTGVMNGLQRDLREKLLIGSPDIRVLSASADMRIDDWQPVLRIVQAQPGVLAAAPFVDTQCLVSAGHSYMVAANVVGVPLRSRDGEVTSIRQHLISGHFGFAGSDGTAHGIIMGKLVASGLSVLPGDSVTVACLGKGETSPVTGYPTPTTGRLEVTGLFETGMYEYDNGFVYVALPLAQEFAGLGSGVTGIEVRTRSRSDAIDISTRLTAAIGREYRTVNWQEQNRSLFQALSLEKAAMTLILLLIVLVAAFNIVSNLTMMVASKRREIGILKAMGLTSAAVRRVFLAQGITIGLVGTVLGVIVGVTASLLLGKYHVIKLNAEVYSIDHLPVTTDPLDLLVTVVASVVIAAVATMYPSVQAARLYPIEAIRSD